MAPPQRLAVLAATLALSGALPAAASAGPPHAAPPRLERQGAAVRLTVQGRPFLIVGGELGNSSDSSAAYMAPHWPRLARMHLNTVFAPVSWELVEPVEGRFDWTSVDQLLAAARANDLKLVLLWFGAWKNSESTYAPSWVKRDERRFPRARLPNGRALDILSAFSPTTRAADARAFTALLAHIKAEDGAQNTVLMIQVENEVGMLPVARDFSAAADRAFHAPVPRELVRMLDAGSAAAEPIPAPPDFARAVAESGPAAPASVRMAAESRPATRESAPVVPTSEARRLWRQHGAKRIGDWAELFGDDAQADEVFSAWYYARYIEALAAAGKAIYPLPMYVNAALDRPGQQPGQYPSGGPLPRLFDVWKSAAPSLDLLAPDIYFPNFTDLAAQYARPNNPLFIPEGSDAGKPEVAANAFYAIGELGALGFGPFSIESIDEREPNPLAEAYEVLRQLAPFILANEGQGRIAGFRPRVLADGELVENPVAETIGRYRFTVSFVDPWTPRAEQNIGAHGGLILQTGPDDYLCAGQGIIVSFAPAGGGTRGAGVEATAAQGAGEQGAGAQGAGAQEQAGIDWAEEGSFAASGEWLPGRRLNGDQTDQGRYLRLPPGRFQIERVRLYRYR